MKYRENILKIFFQYILTRKNKERYAHEVGVKTRCNIEKIL